MQLQTKSSTTRLPQALRDEIYGHEEVHVRSSKSRKPSNLSRKDARKQERQNLKKRKLDFFSSTPSNTKRSAVAEHADSPARKKIKMDASSIPTALSSAEHEGVPKKTPKEHFPPLTPSQSKAPKSRRTRPNSNAEPKYNFDSNRTHVERDEDAYIADLEAKLGLPKRGNKPGYLSEFGDDGLDDLLTHLDSFQTKQSESEKLSKHYLSPDSILEEDETSSGSEVTKDFDERSQADEWHGFATVETVLSVASNVDSKPVPVSETLAAGVQTSSARYVPPHLRIVEENHEEKESLAKLSRQLKGLLNRLSEQNIVSILHDIEGVYRNHRRHDVTTTLTTLIIDGISSHSSLLDSYVVLHAALISSLHKIVGIEFAASFLQEVVSSYQRHYYAVQDKTIVDAEADTVGKECSNLIILLSELYNFQVISCVLIYDLIRELLASELTEFDVELLLKITRNSGQQLRQDDPSALKDIIQIVQTKLAGRADTLSSRTRFMIETLSNLKNNKVKRSNAQAVGVEAGDRMKKVLSSVSKKHHVLAHEPLRVSLNDLRSAETKGKWWLVGAAWGGDPLVDRQKEVAPSETGVVDDVGNDALIRLARKHGMNTEVRRSIFVVLMSSDDFVDACERLSQLNLTEVQQREIIRVLLHCSGNEKSYNPYYTLVGQQLCRTSHSHKVTLQFCLWDFLRDLGETGVAGAELVKSLKDDGGTSFNLKMISSIRMKNVARAYAWWVAKGCCSLLILKPIQFATVKSQTQDFLTEFIRQLFISSQVSSPAITSPSSSRNRGTLEEIFIKVTRVQSLSQRLSFFLTHISQNLAENGPETSRNFFSWSCDVAKEVLGVGSDAILGI